MSTVKHGKFNVNSLDGRVKRNRFYLKDGSNIFRVLPPFGSLADQGSIAKYWIVYWLKDSAGKSKPVPSIFLQDKNKRVLQDDPVKNKISSLDAKLKSMIEQNQPQPIIDALAASLKNLYADKAYYLNVMNTAGEIGVLKLRYTAFQSLKQQLAKLSKDGIDAINVGVGVYFDFQRLKDDQGRTSYKVDLHMKTYKNPTTGKMVTEIVEAPIDEEVLRRMETEAFDLNNLFRVLTPEEQALAATLDPSVIDRLFARPEQAEENGDEALDDEEATVTSVVSKTVNSRTEDSDVSAYNQPYMNPAVSSKAQTVTITGPALPSNAVKTEADLQNLVGQFLRGRLNT